MENLLDQAAGKMLCRSVLRRLLPDRLCEALLSLRSAVEVRAFLRDLCTPAELEALTDRWRVVPLLRRGLPYREIHDHTGVSVTTIGRVARYLAAGNGGYALAVRRLQER